MVTSVLETTKTGISLTLDFLYVPVVSQGQEVKGKFPMVLRQQIKWHNIFHPSLLFSELETQMFFGHFIKVAF